MQNLAETELEAPSESVLIEGEFIVALTARHQADGSGRNGGVSLGRDNRRVAASGTTQLRRGRNLGSC